MRRNSRLIGWTAVAVIGALVLPGCGGADQGGEKTDTPAASDSEATGGAAAQLGGPAASVYVFLEGARSGDDEKVNAMLTPLARAELAKRQLPVAPQASDTARFEVGEVRYPAEGVARVASRWIKVNPASGESSHADMTWVLRKESEGLASRGRGDRYFRGRAATAAEFREARRDARQDADAQRGEGPTHPKSPNSRGVGRKTTRFRATLILAHSRAFWRFLGISRPIFV